MGPPTNAPNGSAAAGQGRLLGLTAYPPHIRCRQPSKITPLTQESSVSRSVPAHCFNLMRFEQVTKGPHSKLSGTSPRHFTPRFPLKG